VLEVLVDLHELVVGGHIEAGAFVKEGPDDLRMRVGFDGVIALDPREMFFENPIVCPDLPMVEDE
jgi:hypothetical protein